MYKALIVDDERMIREGIRSGMPWKELNIDEVRTAGSANEALKILENLEIQILLTDISMEKMDGLELVAKVHGKYPDTRIIVMTAYDRFDYAHQSLRLHVNDFLLKPIEEEDLYAAIDKQVKALDEITRQKHVQPVENNMEHVQMQKLFAEVIRGEKQPDTLLHYAQKNRLRLTDTPYEVVYLVMFPKEGEKAAGRNLEYLFLSAQQIILELVDNEQAGITFYSKDDGAQLILYAGEKDEPQLIINNLRNVIYSEFGLRVRVACGSIVTGADHFLDSYHEANKLMKEALGTYKTVIRPRHTEARSELFSSVFLELKKEMLSDIGNLRYVCRVFDAFVADTESYGLSASEVQAKCFEIASALFYEHAIQTGERAGNQLSELVSALSTAGAEEACAATRGFIVQQLGRMEKTDNAIVNQAKHYIDLHIQDSLSVTVLAEKYYMSVSYFSRLFKKELGIGCNEYIVQSRIHLAQDLLSTTPMTVSEIAERVGYRDKNYFSLAFRRNTGIPPTEYRERHISHQNAEQNDIEPNISNMKQGEKQNKEEK